MVQVFESAPKGATGPDEAYELATALMGKALVEARPALLPRARDILLSIASSDVGSGRADTVLVELSVCELLLGNPSSSLAFLGLAEGPSVRIRQILMRASVDRSVRDFVLENSIGSDYLPGACILAERWVNQVGCPPRPKHTRGRIGGNHAIMLLRRFCHNKRVGVSVPWVMTPPRRTAACM